jgi:hypothetical protein
MHCNAERPQRKTTNRLTRQGEKKMENLNNLPNEVIAKVKNVLKVYSEVNVVFENGEYHVSTGLCLKAHYAADHKFIGTFYAKDVFTEAEKIENYINEFNSYPCNYKGNRDYAKLREAAQKYNAETGTITRGAWKLDNEGNLQLIGTETIKIA